MRTDSLLRSALMGTVVAVVAVVIVFLVADAASGPLLATQPGGDVPEEVPLGGAIFGTILGGLVGTGLAALSRRTPRPVPVFVGICVVGLVLYGIQALTAADTTGTGLWLNVMHIAAAVPIVGSLTLWLQARIEQSTPAPA
ncbi:MAG: DUF6069 family protein [Actinomycetota bacterium]